MYSTYVSRFLALLLSFSLLVAPLPISAMSQLIAVPLSEIEVDIVSLHPDTSFVYCGKERSKLTDILSQIKELDENNNSPLQELCKHIESGFFLAEYNEVIDTLAYAEIILQKNYAQLDFAQAQQINSDLDKIIRQVIDGELVVNSSNGRTISLPSSIQVLEQDSMIGEYADSIFAKRLVAKTPALVVSISDVALSTLLTIDGVTLAVNDRVLLVNQTNTIENGLWEAQTGAWTRPADFNTGDLADQAYVLITSGSTNAGSSWLCTTPAAVIDTDPITFVLFALPDTTLAANVGVGNGLIFKDKTGTTLNFKSLIAGTGIAITNNTDDITIDTNATSANTASTIVARDASGRFSAGAISVTDGVISTSLTLTPFGTTGVVHNNSSGLLSSSLVVNADIAAGAAIVDTKLATIFTAGKVSNSATTANSANLANAIVARDGAGNFGAGTITANLSGNATTATSATTATTSTNFTGSLVGDVTGTQGATVVSFVGGQTAINIGAASVLANAATSINTANTIVRRDASNRFSAGAISVTDEVISSSLTITPFNTAGVVHNSAAGLLSSSLIVNADIAAGAAIVDTKLATISTAGKVANSATTATGVNTANTIVARDASGNFSASTIIANLNGTASNNLLRAGDTMTGTLQLPAGTIAAPSLVFTGSTTAGLSASSGNLIFSTNALERMRISSGGTVSIKAFTSAGVLKNDASGNLSSSLIVDANISSSAAIIDTKLATISTTGKVANSATTATEFNTANTIVKRDVSGNFNANIVTVVDMVASGNLILSTDPSSSTAGNIFKGANTSFIHNFGTDNTFVGTLAGNFTMSGDGQNSIFGANAFTANISGDNNTGVGFSTLPECTTGSNNIAIGLRAGDVLTTGSGNIYIDADAASTSEANTIRIGTSQTACTIKGIRGATATGGISVFVGATGLLGTTTSSIKFKDNIEDMNNASEDIYKLRPVIFTYKEDETHAIQYGLIAEEVDHIFPEIVARDEDNEPYSVQYHVLPVLLLNEMKKQQSTIESLQERMNTAINSLQVQIQELVNRIDTVERHA